MASAQAASGASGAGGASASLSGAFAAGLGDGDVGRSSRETLVRELRDKLVYSARRGVRRLRMSLSPESLGGLDIELRVKGSKVTANIRAESLEAYQALEGEVRTLRDELSAEGLELKLTVSYDGGGQASGGSFHAEDGRRYGLDGRAMAGAVDLAGGGDADGPDPEEISSAADGVTPGSQGVYAGSLLQAVV
ncbi:MAG: flagellar hook-length control protein FliK [Deltaproteobacteria bacterium]|nr:flagellar hook-length control protein FliK [Deltaproteobacteria bacterium]